MRTLAITLLLLISLNQLPAAETLDLGMFAGTSYYLGNINNSRHFYSLSPAGGGLAKYNFNEHYSLRTNINFGRISAYDQDFQNILHQTRDAFFVNNFYEIALQGEFNFQPFKVTIFSKPLSPYITAGLAYTLVRGPENPNVSFVNLPFGGGVKYGISRKITVGMEWILKKSFTDNIDGVKSFGQFNSPSWVHNNDWVSLAGIFVTIKPFERRGDCPVYNNPAYKN